MLTILSSGRIYLLSLCVYYVAQGCHFLGHILFDFSKFIFYPRSTFLMDRSPFAILILTQMGEKELDCLQACDNFFLSLTLYQEIVQIWHYLDHPLHYL